MFIKSISGLYFSPEFRNKVRAQKNTCVPLVLSFINKKKKKLRIARKRKQKHFKP